MSANSCTEIHLYLFKEVLEAIFSYQAGLLHRQQHDCPCGHHQLHILGGVHLFRELLVVLNAFLVAVIKSLTKRMQEGHLIVCIKTVREELFLLSLEYMLRRLHIVIFGNCRDRDVLIARLVDGLNSLESLCIQTKFDAGYCKSIVGVCTRAINLDSQVEPLTSVCKLIGREVTTAHVVDAIKVIGLNLHP